MVLHLLILEKGLWVIEGNENVFHLSAKIFIEKLFNAGKNWPTL